jgi:hypothetical protein
MVHTVRSVIKKLNSKGVRPYKEIAMVQWYHYFSDLLNREPNIENTVSCVVNTFLVEHDTNCEQCISKDPDILNGDTEVNEIESFIDK